MSPPALLRSVFLAWAWALHHDHDAQQRELLRRLRRIDWGER